MRRTFFTYCTLTLFCSMALAQGQPDQPEPTTRDFEIHEAITIMSRDGSRTVMFTKENLTLQIPSKCNGIQQRGISVSTQRSTARNVIDLSSRGLYIIWGYFPTYNDCAEFAGLLLSASQESHVVLKITNHPADQTQSIVVTKDGRSYHYRVKRESYLNPF